MEQNQDKTSSHWTDVQAVRYTRRHSVAAGARRKQVGGKSTPQRRTAEAIS